MDAVYPPMPGTIGGTLFRPVLASCHTAGSSGVLLVCYVCAKLQNYVTLEDLGLVDFPSRIS